VGVGLVALAVWLSAIAIDLASVRCVSALI
jgi:hypothetical protein